MVARDVTVFILHPEPGPAAGPLERAVSAARAALAERHRAGFLEAGASQVRVVSGPPDDTPFGRRLRALTAATGDGGLVVLGSGAIPLATAADRLALVAAASGDTPSALANDRFSADVVAISRAASTLRDDLPDLGADNALPRWLAETAGVPVTDLRRRWRLGVDIDGPLDLVLLGAAWASRLEPAYRDLVERRRAAVRAVSRDARAELLVAGRTSSGSLRWLERRTASRTRALIEERGLRTTVVGQRPPASVLGMLLERDGTVRPWRPPGPPGRRRHHRYQGAAGAPARRRRATLAAGRGPIRVRPAAPRTDRGSVAARADGGGRGRSHPGPARRAFAGRPGVAPGARRSSRTPLRIGAM